MGDGSDSGTPTDAGPPLDDSWRGDDRAASADGRWSNPATWGGQVPAEGDAVTIPAGTTVWLDTDTAPLFELDVEGTLLADPVDVSLTSETVRVSGTFAIGAEDAPFTNEAVITLTGQSGGTRAELEQGIGRRVLAILPGGTLELHGAPHTSWTRLTATAPVGATQITVEAAEGWEVGDRIALAPSDYVWNEVDERTITAVEGTTLTLDAPLDFYHFGELQEIEGFSVDERAEVVLLTRNVVVRGEESSVETAIGGHMIFLQGSTVHISQVEATRLGQRGVNGRYPIHWHLARDVSGQYVRGSAVHHNFQRAFTLHTTDNALLEDNVAWDTFGHAFFFEDATEKGNRILHNVGAMVRRMPEEDRVQNPDLGDDHEDRFDDKHDRRSTVFWITSPGNYFEENVAAGAEHGFGYWFDLFRGEDDETQEEVDLTHEPLRSFRGNVAHSISATDRNNMGYGPLQAGSGLSFEGSFTMGAEDAIIEDFTAYKCRNHGIWGEGTQVIDGAILVGNRVGISNSHFSRTTILRNALIVSDTANRPTAASNISRSPFTGTFQGPIGATFIKGETTLEHVVLVGFGGVEHEQNVAFEIGGQFGKDAHWFRDVRLVDSLPVVMRDREDGGLLLFNDLTGSVLGEAGAVVDGFENETAAFGQSDACAPLDAARFAGLVFCPYHLLRVEVAGDRGTNAANGVYFERWDGLTDAPRAADENAASTILRAAEIAIVHGLDPAHVYRVDGDGAPDLAPILRVEGAFRFAFYKDPERFAPLLDRALPTVASFEALEAASENSLFLDPEGVTYLKVFGGEDFLLCAQAACEEP